MLFGGSWYCIADSLPFTFVTPLTGKLGAGACPNCGRHVGVYPVYCGAPVYCGNVWLGWNCCI